MTPLLGQWTLFREAFEHPVTRGIVLAVALLLIMTPLAIRLLWARGKISAELRKELNTRYISWLVLVPLILLPLLLGRLATILSVGLLSLFCLREFGAVTELIRHRLLIAIVAAGIALLTFAAADHWYGFFVALTPLTICVIVIAAVTADQPKGYIQRVALSVFAFLLFGVCLSHLGLFANDANFRPILLSILLCVEMNDVFAFISGKTFGKRKLAPVTSPGKTVGGALGALCLTTALFALIGYVTFRGTILAHPVHLIAMGALLSVAGQFGDLVLSSIKRDLDIKDMAATIPGHGGLLDRFDSLLLVAPALFHYVHYFVGVGLEQPVRIYTT